MKAQVSWNGLRYYPNSCDNVLSISPSNDKVEDFPEEGNMSWGKGGEAE